MKAAEMVPLLERWKEAHDAIAEADGDLELLTGRSPEAPLFQAMWGAMGCYTEFLELHLVGSANSHWLEWYQFECEMGERPKEVTTERGPKTITSLADLAALLEECRPQPSG